MRKRGISSKSPAIPVMQQPCCHCHLVSCQGAVLCSAALHPAALPVACAILDRAYTMLNHPFTVPCCPVILGCEVQVLAYWPLSTTQRKPGPRPAGTLFENNIQIAPAAIAALHYDDGVGSVAAGHAHLRDGQHICVCLLRVFETKAAWAAQHGAP